MSGNREKYPELLGHLAEESAEVMLEEKLITDRERAADIGFKIAERMRKSWRGHAIYMPAGLAYELSQRDLEIFNRFNGRNIHILAREYDLTEIRIYQIIAKVRTEEMRRRQADLFSGAPD